MNLEIKKIEDFVNKLDSLAEKYEMTDSFRKAVSHCRLAIAMYKMSSDYEGNVYNYFNQVWQHTQDYWNNHQKSYRKTLLFHYINNVITQGI